MKDLDCTKWRKRNRINFRIYLLVSSSQVTVYVSGSLIINSMAIVLMGSWPGTRIMALLLTAQPSLKTSTTWCLDSAGGFGHTDTWIVPPVCTTIRFFVAHLLVFDIIIPCIFTYRYWFGPGSISHGCFSQFFWR